jgi:hypothetical protein
MIGLAIRLMATYAILTAIFPFVTLVAMTLLGAVWTYWASRRLADPPAGPHWYDPMIYITRDIHSIIVVVCLVLFVAVLALKYLLQ